MATMETKMNTDIPYTPDAEPQRQPSELPARQRYPASLHFAFVAGILLPLTVLPWVLSKRHTASLRARLKESEKQFKDVHLDWRTALLELDMIRTQQTRLVDEVRLLKQELAAAKAQSASMHTEVLAAQRPLKEEARRAREEIGDLRTKQTASLQEVGQSLGSVAGFMQEMELHLGLERRRGDHRGIEQLRKTAVRLQEQAGDSSIASRQQR
ncbi:hypothetical protein CC1G_14579 [Coprinopsis cinerea okayama7|uniref:Uncharacterized protein n=1 Tax=Coprinopsis cinerea (strain Okayama-7 / 130 / ATCC MYA-4618 / FGSC 9003) TaxID=240176 RepID=D6RMU2_COPC7|nr:hypothetical protein CC1G_14579 [Coprinopsis cinerea okayama7\|eukprot:XP_002911147.1 hypothetical protein CC1G_14579 [Coprinopsis cinerea okayama7\